MTRFHGRAPATGNLRASIPPNTPRPVVIHIVSPLTTEDMHLLLMGKTVAAQQEEIARVRQSILLRSRRLVDLLDMPAPDRAVLIDVIRGAQQ
jgi:hypothetical protein